jgi:basic amino acid/polyamine antiporter, APA family
MRTKFSLFTATALVIANMVGTGVFTSLGFQVGSLSTGASVLLLWILGGILALFGALSYSEAGVLFPRCGGEYHFLTRMFHPAMGFLAGWISFLVGFAAPVAAAAIALGRYLTTALGLPERIAGLPGLPTGSWIALTVVILITAVHGLDRVFGARFQNIITAFEIVFIVAIIVAGLIFGRSTGLSFAPSARAIREILSPPFVISMYFVTFAYSGWNAAAYVAGEIDRPHRNLPRALISGAIFVAAIYILLNFIFLYVVPIPEMAGKIEIGAIFAGRVFGPAGGRIMGGIIAFLLLANISAMTLAGPRLSKVLGEDYYLFRGLAKHSKKDVPAMAVLIQGAISIIYILTSTFEQVIVFVGFTLNLFTFLTVLGVMAMRRKRPDLPRPYKTLGYPVVPIIFLAFQVWILVYGLLFRPQESLTGLGITALGLLVYAIDKKIRPASFKPADDLSC